MFDDQILLRVEERIKASNMMQWLGLSTQPHDRGLIYHLGFCEEHVGNPVIRAIHGGVISSFLESAALLEALAQAPEGTEVNIISIHTSYLASAKPENMRALIATAKFGRRMGFFEASAYQDHQKSPIAQAAIGIRLKRPEEQSLTS
jgi:uncharacterized protein (TIGR00369 family)